MFSCIIVCFNYNTVIIRTSQKQINLNKQVLFSLYQMTHSKFISIMIFIHTFSNLLFFVQSIFNSHLDSLFLFWFFWFTERNMKISLIFDNFNDLKIKIEFQFIIKNREQYRGGGGYIEQYGHTDCVYNRRFVGGFILRRVLLFRMPNVFGHNRIP